MQTAVRGGCRGVVQIVGPAGVPLYDREWSLALADRLMAAETQLSERAAEALRATSCTRTGDPFLWDGSPLVGVVNVPQEDVPGALGD